MSPYVSDLEIQSTQQCPCDATLPTVMAVCAVERKTRNPAVMSRMPQRPRYARMVGEWGHEKAIPL